MKHNNFNDGTVMIYSAENSAPEGDRPVMSLKLKHTLRYKERTVGLNRYYAALQAHIRVKYLLRCQRLHDVSVHDIAVPNDGCRYRIVQIQYPEDVTPQVMDLTLEEITRDLPRNGGGT